MKVLYERIYVPSYRIYFLFALSKSGKPILNLLKSTHRMIDEVIQMRRKEICQKEYFLKPTTFMSCLLAEYKERSQDVIIRNEISTLLAAVTIIQDKLLIYQRLTNDLCFRVLIQVEERLISCYYF